MEPIHIKGKTYHPRKGDYILDNGACKQFVTGDGRILYMKGFDRYTSVRLTKEAAKKINFAEMKTVVKSNNYQYYYY